MSEHVLNKKIGISPISKPNEIHKAMLDLGFIDSCNEILCIIALSGNKIPQKAWYTTASTPDKNVPNLDKDVPISKMVVFRKFICVRCFDCRMPEERLFSGVLPDLIAKKDDIDFAIKLNRFHTTECFLANGHECVQYWPRKLI
jgi:hypothetical protein